MSTALLPLRPYQSDMLDAFDARWKDDLTRLAGILPTGGGKTVAFAHMAKRHLDKHPGDRVLVLVHTDELVNQAHEKIKMVAPHLSVGIVKAARNEVLADVIVASVQSLRNEKRRKQIRHVGLIVVDECHHATATTYRAILAHFADARVAGFTATLERGDGGPLGEVWQDVAFARDISWMVRKRYLVPPRGMRVTVPDFDLAHVRSTKADFREGELGDALVNSLAPSTVAQAYAEHAKDRSGIAFFPTVASAYVFADAFNEEGIKSEVVHGALSPEERRAILERLESGVTQVVANCMVLTEGFDSPRVSCIVIGRPTKSRPLYIQMVGRGLRVDPSRPYEGQDCLVLHVTDGVTDLRSIADLSEKEIKKPREGASLIELEDELDNLDVPEADPEHFYTGPVEVTEFEMLAARSERAWKRTAGGTYVLPAGKDAWVFLYEEAPAAFTVSWATKAPSDRRFVCCGEAPAPACSCGTRKAQRGGITEHRGLDLEMAMAWGEVVATDMGGDPAGTFSKKDRPWRRKAPSEAAAAMARSLGITVPEKMKAGELSDRIDMVLASRRIDPMVAKAKSKSGEAK